MAPRSLPMPLQAAPPAPTAGARRIVSRPSPSRSHLFARLRTDNLFLVFGACQVPTATLEQRAYRRWTDAGPSLAPDPGERAGRTDDRGLPREELRALRLGPHGRRDAGRRDGRARRPGGRARGPPVPVRGLLSGHRADDDR